MGDGVVRANGRESRGVARCPRGVLRALVAAGLWVEVTTLVDSTNRLFGTVGLEALLPQLVKAIDQVGNESEEIIDHSFRQGVLFILIAMAAYVIARLIYNYLNQKLIKSTG